MSAFIVSPSHIDALLSFANAYNLRCYSRPSHGRDYHCADTGDLTELGKLLLRENEDAYRHRYDDHSRVASDAYTFKFRSPLLDPVEVIKACQCYDYQASEDPMYADTFARRIIDIIREAAIRMLPGYLDAQWEITK